MNKIDRKSKVYNLNAVDVFNNLLKKEWDDSIASFISVEKYQDGNLFIKCSNSSVASEIQLKKIEILNKVNKELKYLKRNGVENIIFI